MLIGLKKLLNCRMNKDIFSSPQAAVRFFEALQRSQNGVFEFRCTKDNPCHLAECDSSSPDLSPIRRRSISPEGRKGEVDLLPSQRFQGNKKNYSEIAEKNAQELINEEERAKNKAEKKKAKKKKQREKKLMNTVKNENHDISNNVYTELKNISLNLKKKEVESVDVNAALVSKAVDKIKNGPVLTESKPKKKEVKNLDSIMNKFIHYEKVDIKEAIQYLSEAISLAPKKIDLVLKRSLLYYELAEFEKSVRDAQKVVISLPSSPEGYYRLGEGHFALKNLCDAEMAFTKLIKLNSHVDEANRRLLEIRVTQLKEMGYHPNEAYTALLKSKNKTIEEAIEYLTELECCDKTPEDLFYSDEEEDEDEYAEDEDESAEDEDESAEDEDEPAEDEDEPADNKDITSEGATGPAPPTNSTSKLNIVLARNSPLLTDPSNPFGCCSLFVGNLKEDITYQEINDVFSKFGEINNIKLTTKPNCYAFVNYSECEPAGLAMEALQGSHWLLSTMQPLLIRFPHNVVNMLIPKLKNPELVLNKLKTISQSKKKVNHSSRSVRQSYIGPVTSKPPPQRFKPHPVKQPTVRMLINNEAPTKYPVVKHNGTRPAPQTAECYFWRTTGCTYEDNCFNLHIPEHKGIALKSSPSKH